MGRAIRAAEWMTDATREEALRKLSGFNYKIGYPDEWRDYTGLVIERGSYAENRMRCEAFEFARQMSRLGKPVDKGEWAMPAHVVNAYYHPLLNEIVFPAGILQPPFFYADADDAVNYGAIGAVIGHEVTHGFDDQGSHFDAHGHLRDWWTEDDRAEFMRRAQVLVEQFDAYEVLEGLSVNGRLTLGENIADLGGLKIAHDALLEALAGKPAAAVDAATIDGLTPEQRFFLSWATVWRTSYTDEYLHLIVKTDPHSPARARVNNPVSNLPAFAAAFGIDGCVTHGSRREDPRAHLVARLLQQPGRLRAGPAVHDELLGHEALREREPQGAPGRGARRLDARVLVAVGIDLRVLGGVRGERDHAEVVVHLDRLPGGVGHRGRGDRELSGREVRLAVLGDLDRDLDALTVEGLALQVVHRARAVAHGGGGHREPCDRGALAESQWRGRGG